MVFLSQKDLRMCVLKKPFQSIAILHLGPCLSSVQSLVHRCGGSVCSCVHTLILQVFIGQAV